MSLCGCRRTSGSSEELAVQSRDFTNYCSVDHGSFDTFIRLSTVLTHVDRILAHEGILVGCAADERGFCAFYGSIHQMLCCAHSFIEPKETTRPKHHSNVTPPLQYAKAEATSSSPATTSSFSPLHSGSQLWGWSVVQQSW